MGNVVAIEQEKPAKKEPARRRSHVAEDPRAELLLVGTDEFGKKVFYFQISVTGLRRRVFGPYRKRSTAIKSINVLLGSVIGGFCDVQNGEQLGAGEIPGMEHLVLPLDLQACR